MADRLHKSLKTVSRAENGALSPGLAREISALLSLDPDELERWRRERGERGQAGEWQRPRDLRQRSERIRQAAEDHLLRGIQAHEAGDERVAVSLLAQAQMEYASIGDIDKEADAHFALGAARNNEQDYEPALRHFEEALRLWSRAGNLTKIGRAYNGMGWNARVRGMADLAWTWFGLALFCAESAQDAGLKATVWTNQALVLMQRGSGGTALELFDRSLSSRTSRLEAMKGRLPDDPTATPEAERANIADIKANMAAILSECGDVSKALALCKGILKDLRELRRYGTAVSHMPDISNVLCSGGQPHAAAIVFSAALAWRESRCLETIEANKHAYEEIRAAIQRTLGIERYEQAIRLGRQVGVEEAIDIAEAAIQEALSEIGSSDCLQAAGRPSAEQAARS